MTVRMVFVTCSYLAVAAVTLLPSAAPNTSLGVVAVPVDQPRVAPAKRRQDHARPIVDVRMAPYAAAVGRLKGAMVCTAAIVLHPRIIITAGHCVANGRPERMEITFQPGYKAGTDFSRFKAAVWAIGAHQQLTAQSVREASNDWAILVLERAPIGIRPFRLSNRSADTLKQLRGQILLPSYSVDVAEAQALSVDPTCSVQDLLWNVLLHDCKASLGGSGAPLLIRDQQWYEVVGIHSASLLVNDEKHHSMQFIGSSAIGVWTLTEALHALFRRLNSGDDAVVFGSLRGEVGRSRP